MAEYPHSAGSRGVDTSLDAARSIDLSVGHLQRVALRAIRAAGSRGLSTNELVAVVHIHRDSIQPRTSELARQGLIRDSGLRRRNANGKYAIVWVAESLARSRERAFRQRGFRRAAQPHVRLIFCEASEPYQVQLVDPGGLGTKQLSSWAKHADAIEAGKVAADQCGIPLLDATHFQTTAGSAGDAT